MPTKAMFGSSQHSGSLPSLQPQRPSRCPVKSGEKLQPGRNGKADRRARADRCGDHQQRRLDGVACRLVELEECRSTRGASERSAGTDPRIRARCTSSAIRHLTLLARKEAWADAYRRTPHGKPVELENEFCP